jgi:hypothetical protein
MMSNDGSEQLGYFNAIELDVWQAAVMLVRKYGKDAPGFAAAKIDAGENSDDLTARVWKFVMRASQELLRVERRADELVN